MGWTVKKDYIHACAMCVCVCEKMLKKGLMRAPSKKTAAGQSGSQLYASIFNASYDKAAVCVCVSVSMCG